MPDSFEELSGKQFIGIAELLYNGGDSLECSLKALRILTGLSRIKFRFLGAEMIDRCIPFIKWVFEEKRITKQLIPVYKGYYGPVSDFDNLKMKEFHFGERCYHELVYQKKEEAINPLIASLYRRAKPVYDKKRDPDGDIRIAFNANELAYYANKIAWWPDPVKHAIFLWYHDCRRDLIENNPLVFKEPTDGFESQFDTGLYGVMRSLAGDKLGTVGMIEEMYVHTAMLELGLLKEEEQRIEEQTKNQTT